MVNGLQQLALVDTLIANWDSIRMRIGAMPPALAADFMAIGQKLKDADSLSDVEKTLDDLLKLTRGTPAASYVRELVARASLGELSSSREAGAPQAVIDLQAEREAPALTRESVATFGLSLSQTDSPIGVKRVPIFFGTNRKPGGPSATAFLGDPAEAMSYGLAWVTIPLGAHKIGRVETPRWWNIFADEKDQGQYFTCDVNSLKQPEFAAKLEQASRAAESPEILIFLHGFNVTFEEAAMRAAQFANDSNFPGVVVLFSWPSEGSIRSYAADEARADGSSDTMAEFLKGLENGPWQQVHLLAHSMGNRVMLAALADNPRPKLPLGQLVFAAADVYVPVFTNKFPKVQNAGRLSATSYASKRDRALWLSSLFHRGPRIGLIDDIPYVTDNLESIDATAVDTGMLAHGYWSGERPLITDLRSLLLHGLGAKARGLDQIGKYWAFPK